MGNQAVILSKEEYDGLIGYIDSVKAELDELKRKLSDRQINRAYVMRVTGWSRQTLWRRDRDYSIFNGEKTTSLNKFNDILDRINGTRASSPH